MKGKNPYFQGYFRHDSNARNDEKILKVRIKYGAEGYGIYFMLLERLREDKNYLNVTDYEVIGFDFRVDSNIVKSIVEDFGLFELTEDKKHFYSPALIARMHAEDKKDFKKSEKARRAANARWEKEKKENEDIEIMQEQCTSNADAMQRNADAMQRNADAMQSDAKKRREEKRKEEKRKENNKKEKKKRESPMDIFLNFSGGNKELEVAFREFVNMRSANKSKLTPHGAKLAIAELKKMNLGEHEMIEVINQSTLKGWKSFYPLQNTRSPKSNKDYFDVVDEWARG